MRYCNWYFPGTCRTELVELVSIEKFIFKIANKRWLLKDYYYNWIKLEWTSDQGSADTYPSRDFQSALFQVEYRLRQYLVTCRNSKVQLKLDIVRYFKTVYHSHDLTMCYHKTIHCWDRCFFDFKRKSEKNQDLTSWSRASELYQYNDQPLALPF